MRRWIVRGFAATALAGIALLSGCTKLPSGADGNLANQWPALAEVKGWEPKAGTCHTDFADISYRRSYKPVECTTTHSYETAHVGAFKGTGTAAPKLGDADFKTAWSECDKQVTAYLGSDWRNARIWFGVSVPSPGSWAGGARWFRCEVSQLENTVGDDTTSSTSSVKGKGAELRYGCYQIAEKKGGAFGPRDCKKTHNSEFAGTFVGTKHFDSIGKSEFSALHAKCRTVIARYVGVPNDGMLKYRTGTYLMYPDKTAWDTGDHSVRCYIYLGSKKLTRSLKGTGNGGLPINYA